jgi:chemotaxis protein methyltransferase CheR
VLNSIQSRGAAVLGDGQFDQLCKLIYEHTGIKLTQAKRELVSRRFLPRLKSLGLQDFDDYLALIRSGDEAELVEFGNAITTNLTSFFRENHHFEFLKKDHLAILAQRNKLTKRLRIWSAGCSTGPEPYSIAMVLHEAMPGLNSWDAKILATDLDTACLAKAAAGLYSEKTVEGISTGRQQRWFDRVQQGDEVMMQAKECLQSLVRFNQLNLLGPFPFAGKFDVIFCRNVFIYFDKPTQQEIVRKFADHQREGDLLIIGHSENLHSIATKYELVGQTIYRRMAK